MRPDLSAFGKVIGGGLPVGAFGGRAEIMDVLAPLGPVYQAGTLSGNPLATAAGGAALAQLTDAAYATLTAAGRALRRRAGRGDRRRRPDRAGAGGRHAGRPVLRRRRGRSTTTRPASTDEALYAAFFHEMLDRGVALAPGAYEVLFVGLAHTDDVLDQVVETAAAAAAAVAARA